MAPAYSDPQASHEVTLVCLKMQYILPLRSPRFPENTGPRVDVRPTTTHHLESRESMDMWCQSVKKETELKADIKDSNKNKDGSSLNNQVRTNFGHAEHNELCCRRLMSHAVTTATRCADFLL